MEREHRFVRRHPLFSSIVALGSLSAGALAYKFHEQIPEVYDAFFGDPSEDLPEETPEATVSEPILYYCFKDKPNCDHTSALATIYSGGNSIPKALGSIDDDVEHATVAVEDHEFYTRKGIDYTALIAAVATNIRAGEIVRGSSTIIDQVASNLYAQSVPHYDKMINNIPLTLEDKIDQRIWELNTSKAIEAGNTNDQILEKYLNIVNYGRGAYGIEMAAYAYFGKSAADLTVVEAATLAGIPKSPDGYDGSNDPTKDPVQRDKLLSRRNVVLGAMQEYGYITRAEYDQYVLEPLNILPYHVISSGPAADYSVADSMQARHFLDRVISEFNALPEEDRVGVKYINTTLSYFIQAQVSNAANIILDELPDDGPQIATVVLDEDGGVIGEYGGDFSTEQTDLTISPQPGGSADKPYFVTEALIKGTTSFDMRYPEPEVFTWEGGDNGADWHPSGGTHCSDHSSCGIAEALAVSSNPVTLQVAEDMGPTGIQDTYALMEALGSHSDTSPQPASVLGARETSVLGRTTMMMNLVARQGSAVTPHHINSTYAYEDGNLVEKYQFTLPTPTQPVDATIAAGITDALRGVPLFGTASNQLNEITTLTDIAGKTGTDAGTDDTGTDNENVIANFYGVACIAPSDGSEPYNITIGVAERYPDGLFPLGSGHTGGNYPAKTFKTILKPIIGAPCRIN